MENKWYRVRYAPLAFGDLDEIDSYITETLGNEAAAERLLDKMEKAIDQLKRFPYIGAEVEDVYLATKGYRKLVVENYLIFYLVHEARAEVVVMRILYGAREYHDLL